METNINIAEILKDMPKGTKLYSTAFGEVTYDALAYGGQKIWVLTKDKNYKIYLSDGRYRSGGEITLYPSKEMRDWSKFSWKKGDILVSNSGKVEVIFEKFISNTYQAFIGKHHLDSLDENPHYQCGGVYATAIFNTESKDATQTYINNIEKCLDGKLNLQTLKIEKLKPEFKDGDIVVTDAVPSMCYSKCIFILKGGLNACESRASSYVFYNIDSNFISFGIVDRTIRDRNIHLATVEEKLELFDALTKEGKYWDDSKKEVIDLKPKVRFKPFDKIVALGKIGREWVCDMFSHYSKDYKGKETIVGIGGLTYSKAVPFNEKTAKLIGTTKEWKE